MDLNEFLKLCKDTRVKISEDFFSLQSSTTINIYTEDGFVDYLSQFHNRFLTLLNDAFTKVVVALDLYANKSFSENQILANFSQETTNVKDAILSAYNESKNKFQEDLATEKTSIINKINAANSGGFLLPMNLEGLMIKNKFDKEVNKNIKTGQAMIAEAESNYHYKIKHEFISLIDLNKSLIGDVLVHAIRTSYRFLLESFKDTFNINVHFGRDINVAKNLSTIKNDDLISSKINEYFFKNPYADDLFGLLPLQNQSVAKLIAENQNLDLVLLSMWQKDTSEPTLIYLIAKMYEACLVHDFDISYILKYFRYSYEKSLPIPKVYELLSAHNNLEEMNLSETFPYEKKKYYYTIDREYKIYKDTSDLDYRYKFKPYIREKFWRCSCGHFTSNKDCNLCNFTVTKTRALLAITDGEFEKLADSLSNQQHFIKLNKEDLAKVSKNEENWNMIGGLTFLILLILFWIINGFLTGLLIAFSSSLIIIIMQQLFKRRPSNIPIPDKIVPKYVNID